MHCAHFMKYEKKTFITSRTFILITINKRKRISIYLQEVNIEDIYT